MRILLDPARYRPLLLVVAWGFVMWLVSRWLELPGFEFRTSYGTLLWVAVSYVGVVLILYFYRPRA